MFTFISRKRFGRRQSWSVPTYYCGFRLEKLRIITKISVRIAANLTNIRTVYLLNKVLWYYRCSTLLGGHRQELPYSPKHYVSTGLMCLAYFSPRISRSLNGIMTLAERGQVPTCCALFLGLLQIDRQFYTN
jgi:hypothetical protein